MAFEAWHRSHMYGRYTSKTDDIFAMWQSKYSASGQTEKHILEGSESRKIALKPWEVLVHEDRVARDWMILDGLRFFG